MVMELFTSDSALQAKIAEELSSCGCCSRCVLRYLGANDMFTYRGNTQEITDIVKNLRGSKEEKDLQENEHKESKPVEDKEENDKAACETDFENIEPQIKVNEDLDITDESGDKVKETGLVENGDSKVVDPMETSQGSKMNQNVVSSCVICLGILDKFTDDSFLQKIKQETIDAGFHFTNYLCSLTIPVCVILREHALLLHLKEKFKEVYEWKLDSSIPQIKDIWKWRNGPILKEILNAPFDSKSAFGITLMFEFEHSARECTFLLSSSESGAFRKRKEDRRWNKKSVNALYTRANVGKAVEQMSDDEFKRSYQCPPVAPSCETRCDIKCQNENVFVAGRYNKYNRELSQTPWLIEGVRKSESSVEELLVGEITKHFKHDEQKFSSSGREDVDVRMLGNGRPFVLELVNPRRREFTQAEMTEMEKATNASTKDIKCRDLQIVTKEETEILKQGEIDKVKWYQALCCCDQPVTDEQLQQLATIKDLKVFQKTPVRVLHRRPLATRDRLIHTMNVSRVDEKHFTLNLSTQAGTYIKEFVHGDFGRTKPNLSTVLGVECDILQLDVTNIELDWPKKINSTEENDSKPKLETDRENMQ